MVATIFAVLIESDWNLKITQVQPLKMLRRINRIRLEFKGSSQGNTFPKNQSRINRIRLEFKGSKQDWRLT